MNIPKFFDPKNSIKLFGLQKDFDFIFFLYLKNKLPKVLMFSGIKGTGKSTLINHFLFSIFDKKNYDKNTLSLIEVSNIYNQFKNNIFSNIIYIEGSNFKSVNIENIRNLKTKILQSTINYKSRFIIFNDIELFNPNTLNALLKIIEEPSNNNFFFLINNKSKPLLDTVKSRALEIKIILAENQRLEIIKNLVNLNNLELIIDPKESNLSPGNFLKFNFICKEYNIVPQNDFIQNISLLLNLYKKNKDILFMNLAFFITDYYFRDTRIKKILNNDKIYEIKNFIFDNLNKFLLYNINQNALINSLNNKLNNE